ncbi:MAG: hypothetical protein ACFFCC_04975 [Promethearchaeota archaeon]
MSPSCSVKINNYSSLFCTISFKLILLLKISTASIGGASVSNGSLSTEFEVSPSEIKRKNVYQI